MAKTILILTLDDKVDFMQNMTLLRHMAEIWQQQGFEVKVARGVKQQIEADIAIAHVDLTVIPDDYTAFLNQYPVVINAAIKNISKSLISENQLTRNDEYSGPVIVKTLANYGGVPELLYDQEHGKLQAGTTQDRPWRHLQYLDSHHYPRFDSISAVPSGVWRNSLLMVEKFLPEIDESGHYCVRKWSFFGDQDSGMYQTSSNPIIKTAEQKNEKLTEVPEELRAMRERLKVDYGRFDYVMVDGKLVVFDLNTTPSIGRNGLALMGDNGLAEFARGIEFYLH